MAACATNGSQSGTVGPVASAYGLLEFLAMDLFLVEFARYWGAQVVAPNVAIFKRAKALVELGAAALAAAALIAESHRAVERQTDRVIGG